jgi:NAD(P)-dependent dehydrogenase (short-subunit alcohol dehydrogenase family)
MAQLENRIAFITGGSRGIGRGAARAYAEQGAIVIIASRGVEVGTAAAQEINRDYPQGQVVFMETDIADRQNLEDRLDQVAAEFGDVSILVNNATPSGGDPVRLEYVNSGGIQHMAAVNYYAPLWAMQKLFPSMKANRWGRIISMCSLNGINAHRYTAGYNGSKEALRALTRTAAAEWGRYGITSNVICPAAVTEPWEKFVELDPDATNNTLKHIPMGRLGDSERDIGPLAVFLASDGSGFITGNTIHADGGGHIGGVPWSFELPE